MPITLTFRTFSEIIKKFELCEVQIIDSPTYHTEYYALFGEYVYIFEKCEKKKLLSNKFTEVVLKPVSDYIGISIKIFMKQMNFIKNQEKIISKNYVNGCLP